MQTELLETNNVHSPVTEEFLNVLDKRSRTDFFHYISEVEFIQNLLDPKRAKARNLPKDRKGRIIVDVTKPHILENMDFFTERADYFRKYGRYTDIYPNPAPGSEYRKFWDEERRRCKEGLVRPSDGEWIPGYYYFYLNYSPILIVEEIEKYEEGELNKDAKGDINRIVGDYLDNEELEGIQAERVEDFPNVYDGDYLFFHYVDQAMRQGKHGSVLKTRGRGYSFKGGGMMARNYFLHRASKSYAFASETEYLTRDGILSKAWSNINFIDSNTPFTQPRDYKDTEMHKRASYKDTTHKTERGFMAEVIGVTCKNEPDKGRGKRGKLLFFDEAGIFPGLKKTWGIARKSVEQGRYTYGFMVTAGTGGTEGADFEAAEAFFYSPGAYNIFAVKNVFDESKGHSECAFFAPEYLNREGCFDKNGNSDVTKALVEILYSWQKVRNSSSDPNDLVHEKAEAPITPQHAVLRIEGSIFPTQDLKDYLSEIAPHMSRFVSSHYTGRLKVSGDGVVDFVYQEDKTPIRDYPIKDNLNKEGCIEIFEPPQRLSTGYVPKYRYIAGIDTYDDDHSTTNSLGSILILDRLTDRIVAEYTGRPTTANEFYEICLRLLKYYNAIANYENDKKGLYGYFFNKNQLHYLCDNPEILADKNLAKIQNNYGNKKKGTNSGVAINAWGRRLQADWLVSNAYGTGGEDEEGNELPPLMNLQKLRSIGYIKELIQWHPDINADRVSAAGMLFILRADMERMDTEGTTETSSIAKDDPFFKRTGNPYGNVSAF